MLSPDQIPLYHVEWLSGGMVIARWGPGQENDGPFDPRGDIPESAMAEIRKARSKGVTVEAVLFRGGIEMDRRHQR